MSDAPNQADTAWPGGAFVFPYHMGPPVRRFTIPLLWSGRLIVTMPGWFGPTIDDFEKVRERASELSHPLEPLFDHVAYQMYEVVQHEAITEIKNVEPLGDLITRIMLVQPGTREAYEKWTPLRARCFPILSGMLKDPSVLGVAAFEFIWRVYELYLELDGSPDAVLSHLHKQAVVLGDERLLLLECALHRFSLHLAEKHLMLCTDSAAALNVLAEIGREVTDGGDDDDPSARAAQLSLLLFEGALADLAPPLESPHADRIARIVRERNDELQAARRKCVVEAEQLVDARFQNARLRVELNHSIQTLRSEVESIVDADSATVRAAFQHTLEDKAFWGAAAALIGSPFTAVPAVVAASAAVTAFTVLGTEALKARRKTRELLKTSPWRFAYQLRKGPH